MVRRLIHVPSSRYTSPPRFAARAGDATVRSKASVVSGAGAAVTCNASGTGGGGEGNCNGGGVCKGSVGTATSVLTSATSVSGRALSSPRAFNGLKCYTQDSYGALAGSGGSGSGSGSPPTLLPRLAPPPSAPSSRGTRDALEQRPPEAP